MLVARLRAGDPTAFEVLYERHVPGLLSFCRHMLGDPEEAEDAVQQAFASAHADLRRSQREINFKPWLYTIARNRCVSALRARRDQSVADPEISTAGLSEQVERRADLHEMLSDIHDLPGDQRAALVLTELDDLSQADVAEVLGCGVSNVKGLVFRARAGLAERREAREAPCTEIRAELASARRGGLRRGRLRHHVRACAGCAAYLEDVRRQRRLMAVLLPVVPSLGLKDAVLAATGLGGGGAAGGLGATAGGAALFGTGSTVAKLAVVGALAGGVGVMGPPVIDSATDGDDAPPAAAKPAAKSPRATPPAVPVRPAAGKRHLAPRGRARRVRRRGAGTPGASAPGRLRSRATKTKPLPPSRVPRTPPPGLGSSSRPATPPGRVRARPDSLVVPGRPLERQAPRVPKLK